MKFDAELGQAPQHAQSFGAIRRLAPDAASGHAHRAKAEAMDRDLSADLEHA